MTDDEIKALALECGLCDKDLSGDGDLMTDYGDATASVLGFAYALIAAEREACAVLLDENAQRCSDESMMRLILETNASAIRARKG